MVRTANSVLRAFVLSMALAVGAASGAWADTSALRLIMFEESGCPWCDKWREEIGVVYAKTTEGKRAPLTRHDVHDLKPKGVKLKTGVFFSPTFVLVKNGEEVGRIEGYPGEDFFWALLGQMIKRADAAKPAG